MHLEKALRREILVWFITYILIASTYFFVSYITWLINSSMIIWILVLGLSITWPVYLSIKLLGTPIYLLGVVASFTTLLIAYQRLNLRGLKLIRFYMLPHPLIVSLYQASLAFFYHATDTPWWAWLLYGVIAYLWLITVAYIVYRVLRRILPPRPH